MSPLLRPDVPGAVGRCRVHRRTLTPAPRPVPGELEAMTALAGEAVTRLREQGIPAGSSGQRRGSRPYCPQCAQELAEAAAQRLTGPDEDHPPTE